MGLKENVVGVWLFKACLGMRYVAGACNSVSIRVLGCLETPSAFLEAVPSAWTVTPGVVVALRASTVTSSVSGPVSRVPPTGPLGPKVRVGERSAKWEKENYQALPRAKHSNRLFRPKWALKRT